MLCSAVIGEIQQQTWQHPASFHEKSGDRMRNSPAKWQYRENLPRSDEIAKCNNGLAQSNEHHCPQWEVRGTNSPFSFKWSLFTVGNLLHQKELEMVKRIDFQFLISPSVLCSSRSVNQSIDPLAPLAAFPFLLYKSLVKPNIVFLGNVTKPQIIMINSQHGWS